MPTYRAAFALLLAPALVMPAPAATRTDRLAVSAVVEGGCSIVVPRLLAQLRAARRSAPVCAVFPRTAPPPPPIVILTREPGTENDLLTVEF